MIWLKATQLLVLLAVSSLPGPILSDGSTKVSRRRAKAKSPSSSSSIKSTKSPSSPKSSVDTPSPTPSPTRPPTGLPTNMPTTPPTNMPTMMPTTPPTDMPTMMPTMNSTVTRSRTFRLLKASFEEVDDGKFSACDLSIPNFGDEAVCKYYHEMPLYIPDCSNEEEVVPRIVHIVSKDGIPALHHKGLEATNPSYIFKYYSDDNAQEYIREKCGEVASQAYECLLAPSYRADLFRFCAMYAEGGVYLDEDILPLVPLDELYSPCSDATIGHDFPIAGVPGKQMKVLAATKDYNIEAPIFSCALDEIIERVKNRYEPQNNLELTGPLLLNKCYEMHNDGVAVSYIDTTQAKWPYTGLRAGTRILAYEIPSEKHFTTHHAPKEGSLDYASLFAHKNFYSNTCKLQEDKVVLEAGETDVEMVIQEGHIPRQSFVTWKTTELNKDALPVHEGWLQNEPTLPRRVVTDAECRLLASNYPNKKLLEAYDSFPLNVMRADVCRLLAVYAYGGVYMDLDVIWERPIDSFFDFDAATGIQIGHENDRHFCNWFFGATKQHPCVATVLDLIATRGQDVDASQEEFVHHYSGPGVFTDGLKECGATPVWSRYEMFQGNIKHGFGSVNWRGSGDYTSWVDQAMGRGLRTWNKDRDDKERAKAHADVSKHKGDGMQGSMY